MTCYYGGKFNPFTKGHLSVLTGLFQKLEADGNPRSTSGPKIVIGVKIGDMSGSEGLAMVGSTDYRVDMVNRGLESLRRKYPYWDIQVVRQDIQRTWNYFRSHPEWFPDDDRVTIVMGDDEYKLLMDSVQKERDGADKESGAWHHAVDIVDNYNVLGFPRDPVVSSTRVREIYRANPYVNYSDISDYIQKNVHAYIAENLLYWQEGDESEARQAENNFLTGYDMSKFPRPSCTATVDVLWDNKVLMVRRKGHPYKGFWALPGGFFDVDKDESLEETAQRELDEETGLRVGITQNHQFKTYSARGLDPRGRILDTVYFRQLDEKPTVMMAGDDAAEIEWWHVNRLPRMAFHHRKAVEECLASLEKEE